MLVIIKEKIFTERKLLQSSGSDPSSDVFASVHSSIFFLNSLETTYIKDIISSSTIYYDPNDSTTTIGEDIEFIKIYKEFEEQDENCDAESPWLLRFKFNKEKIQHCKFF